MGDIKKIKGSGRGFYLNYNERPFRRQYRKDAKVVVIRPSREVTPEARTRFGDETLMSSEEVLLGRILCNQESTSVVADLTDEQCDRVMNLIMAVAEGQDPSNYKPKALVTQDDPVVAALFEKIDISVETGKSMDIRAYGHVVEESKPEFGSHVGKLSGKAIKPKYVKVADREDKGDNGQVELKVGENAPAPSIKTSRLTKKTT